MRMLACMDVSTSQIGVADIVMTGDLATDSIRYARAVCPSGHSVVQINAYDMLDYLGENHAYSAVNSGILDLFSIPDAENIMFAFQAGFILLLTVWIAGYGFAALIQFLKKVM